MSCVLNQSFTLFLARLNQNMFYSEMSHSCLAGVNALKLRWQLSNMNVIQLIWLGTLVKSEMFPKEKVMYEVNSSAC